MIPEPPFIPGYRPTKWRELSLSKQYRYSCYLYYHGPQTPQMQSPLTDAEFDELQVQLGKSKTKAFTITLTENEILHVEEIMRNHIHESGS